MSSDMFTALCYIIVFVCGFSTGISWIRIKQLKQMLKDAEEARKHEQRI